MRTVYRSLPIHPYLLEDKGRTDESAHFPKYTRYACRTRIGAWRCRRGRNGNCYHRIYCQGCGRFNKRRKKRLTATLNHIENLYVRWQYLCSAMLCKRCEYPPCSHRFLLAHRFEIFVVLINLPRRRCSEYILFAGGDDTIAHAPRITRGGRTWRAIA